MIALTGKVIALNIAATTASASRMRRRAHRWTRRAIILAAIAVVYFGARSI